MGVSFPLHAAAANPGGMSRELGSPGGLYGRRDNVMYLRTLGGLKCPVVKACHHMKHFNKALFGYIINTQPDIEGLSWPQPNNKGEYHAAEMTRVICERVVLSLKGRGRALWDVREQLRQQLPCVRLYRYLRLTNKSTPGCVLYLRAHPFKGQAFRGERREDCFFAVPERDDGGRWDPPESYVLQDKAQGTWVGRVIAFFTVMLWDGGRGCTEHHLAFVHWADDYAADACVDDMPLLAALSGCHRLYWPTTPWYDIIDCARILGMEPIVPDFQNDGKVPGQDNVQRNAPQGRAGAHLVLRNPLAREFGRCKPFCKDRPADGGRASTSG